MLSLREILFTAAIVAAVWLAFRWFDRQRNAQAGGREPRGKQAAATGAVQDLVACPRCSDYAAAGAAPCSRPDCPRR